MKKLVLAIFVFECFIIVSDGFGMYDPQVGRFMQQDPLAAFADGYVDGINMYEYATTNPIIYWDPFGEWSWRSSSDVWIIQTILNNNALRFGLYLGDYGPGKNGIDGKYGYVTENAVCKFQKVLVKAGCGLPAYGADGKWGAEMTAAFENCERCGKVNYRYAHIRLGVFLGAGYIVEIPNLPVQIPSGSAWGGIHANLREMNKVDWEWGAIITSDDSTGIYGQVGALAVIGYNIFNAEDWRSLSGTGFDWNADIGPFKGKIAKTLKQPAKMVFKIVADLVSNKDSIEAAIQAIKASRGNAIWRGKADALQVPISLGLGGSAGSVNTTYKTTDFEIGF